MHESTQIAAGYFINFFFNDILFFIKIYFKISFKFVKKSCKVFAHILNVNKSTDFMALGLRMDLKYMYMYKKNTIHIFHNVGIFTVSERFDVLTCMQVSCILITFYNEGKKNCKCNKTVTAYD